MKIALHKNGWRAFTVSDLLIVLIVVALLIGLILPACTRSPKAPRISCLSNLKHIGLAFRMWANDHNDTFPMVVSTNAGGTLQFTGKGETFRHFLVVSDELLSPKVLTCPADARRRRTTNFLNLSNSKLSYFVGLDCSNPLPQMILTGDRNLTTNGALMSGLLMLSSNTPVAWTKDLHSHAGNLGLADGSALQARQMDLQRQIACKTNFPQRISIP